ncbi:MAG: D-alanyl-D-alanine carboxypeptidase [Chitinophagaceae bacterium]|nr:D-alanyl-D-alanine carboxypeptidase [Chitinophagaceae bacterium]
MKIFHFLFLIPYFLFSACSVSKQISKQADTILIQDSAINQGHIGISIFEPATGKYWYDYQAEKYFVPASNTKLFSLYAGMKYLGDSLVGLSVLEYNDRIYLQAMGDPTLLHPDFKSHPVFNFLVNSKKTLWGSDSKWKATAWGNGWAWNDYEASYMPERSALPIYGNLARFSGKKNDIKYYPKAAVTLTEFPIYSKNGATGYIDNINRELKQNIFKVGIDGKTETIIEIPFITSGELSFKLLSDTLKKAILPPNTVPPIEFEADKLKTYVIHSQPTDTFLKIMMHRSDNFFAEQTLLMASNERLGYMSDRKMIDTLLKTDLKDIPQKPRWVDGSGLSRYNLFTPKDFIYILQKLKNEFSFERLKIILPTGGTGTLSSLYKKDSGYIFAKTGTLSNHVALSGFLITKQNKLLIFSILAGNFTSAATPVRKAIEKFLSNIRQRY